MPIRLALAVVATGVAAALLVIRKPSEQPTTGSELTSGAQAAIETETDSWFV